MGLNGVSCAAFTLCGNSFPIGETQLASIPGFDSTTGVGTLANWALTSPVNFDTTPYSNTYLVYWVVTWMEDGNGNLIPEMPGHGLTANPEGMSFQQIGQVPVESYSNNEGMYGVNSPFFIFPANPGVEAPARGVLESVSISTNKKLLIDQPAKVITHLRAEKGKLKSVNLTYFDGDPRKGGKLFDVQKITHMDADVTYTHRAFFHPQTCGIHRLYAKAWVDDAPEVIGDFTTSVTIQPIHLVNALIISTQGMEMNRELRHDLLFRLKDAAEDFGHDQSKGGVSAINNYVKQLSSASGREIRADRADRLIAQARVITGCVPGSAITPQPRASAIADIGRVTR